MLHLARGALLDASPTLEATIAAVADARGEAMVSLGPTRRDVDGMVPMPGGRMSIAGSMLHRWLDQSGVEATCFAWDVESTSVAAAAGMHVVSLIDGLQCSGWAIRRAAQRMAVQGMPTVLGSPAVSDALDVAARCGIAAQIVPLVGPVEALGPEGDDVLEIVVLAEPVGHLTMRGVVGLIGRLHLLGESPRVRIAGDPVDRSSVCAMLEAIGIDDVRLCTVDALWDHIGPGSLIWSAPAWRPAGQVEAAAPAMRAWMLGATVMLCSGHGAADAMVDLPGVFLDVDLQTDEVVRAILAGDAARGLEHRLDVGRQWWSDTLEAIERFSVTTTCGC